MTAPRQGGDAGFTPARRRARTGRAPGEEAPEYDDSDVERGRTTALLGTLGRLQLRVDVLAQQQAEAFNRLTELLEGLDRRLQSLEERQSGAGPQRLEP